MIDRPWLKHYDSGVPHTLQPYPDHTLLEVVRDSASQRPDHPALLFKGASMSYRELEQQTDAFSAALVALGVKKGDRVMLLMPNCPQAVIGQLGVWKAGAIAAPLNPTYTERELEFALLECGAETVIVLSAFYPKIKAIQSRTGVRRVIVTNIKEYLPPALRLLFTLLKEKKEGHRVTLESGDLWFQDLLRQHAGAPRPAVTVTRDDAALILFSGGTTGLPKAVVGEHHALLEAGMQIHAWSTPLSEEWTDVMLLAIPLFHVYANVGAMGKALVGHNPIALVPNPRDLKDLIATIRKVKPGFFPAVPTLFIALLARPEVQAGEVDFKSMKLCISAAAPLLAETKLRFETLTGGKMVEAYGMTETMLASAITPVTGLYKPGAVGIPLPDVEMRVVNAETGEETMPPGEVGEIVIRAPQLMRGFWGRPTETANTIRDGWLFTGDLGYLDEDGYLFIVDRKKDVIKPGGFQVWPREVEEVIASHPAVKEVGVAGIPDEYQGEAVAAWVVLREGYDLTEDALRAYCREKLASYKVPRRITFASDLPKSMVGKVLRRLLTEESGGGSAA
jgi:long-chain acyl-CoA synthetase